MPVTMQDVARHAAVSTATVSRAINNPEKVDPETLASVQAAIETLGYKMNTLARSLRTRQTYNLALVIDALDGNTPLIESFEEAALEAGYMMMLCNTRGEEQLEQGYLHILADQQRADGVFWSANQISDEIVNTLMESDRIILFPSDLDEPLSSRLGHAAVHHLVKRIKGER